MNQDIKNYSRGLLYIMGTWIILLLLLLLTSCGKQYIPINNECRLDPKLSNINVKEGCICGEELNKLIDNHITLWEYIEYLKIKANCK